MQKSKIKLKKIKPYQTTMIELSFEWSVTTNPTPGNIKPIKCKKKKKKEPWHTVPDAKETEKAINNDGGTYHGLRNSLPLFPATLLRVLLIPKAICASPAA